MGLVAKSPVTGDQFISVKEEKELVINRVIFFIQCSDKLTRKGSYNDGVFLRDIEKEPLINFIKFYAVADITPRVINLDRTIVYNLFASLWQKY